MNYFLFVYGTLKRGYGNNRLLRSSEFVGKATSEDSYILYNGGFPYAVRGELADLERPLPIIGEVWKVGSTVMQHTDQLEGHPDWYERKERVFNLEDGGSVLAWIYELPHRVPNRNVCNIVNNCYEWR